MSIIATNEKIIIWAFLGFEECVFVVVVFTIYGLQSMERDDFNKLTTPFQQ